MRQSTKSGLAPFVRWAAVTVTVAATMASGAVAGSALAQSAASAAATASASPPGAWVDSEALRQADGFANGWLTHGRTYSEQRYSPLSQIDEETVGQLGLVWSFNTDTRRGLEATPIVVDGRLYATGTWSVVFALDARSGELEWRYDPQVPREYGPKACCDVVNRGVAIYRGKVFVGTLDGRLVALDAESGEPVWEVVTVDRSVPYTITGAPRVVKGKVIIGNGGAEYGVRGYVSAYDAESGELKWRCYTVPGDPSKPFESKAMEKAAATWSGEWWKIGGGGTVWDSMAFDPELDLLYIGTGNGSPWNRHVRSPGGGDNLYLSSILALDPDSGEIVWHYQTTPGDSWDYTATQHLILADLEIAGRARKVILQAPKNGFFYVLDRASGELLSAEPYVPVSWAERVDLASGRPVESPSADYGERPAMVRPSALGGHNWQPMSYNPQTGLVYLPAQERAAAYAHNDQFVYRPGTWNTGTLPAPAELREQARSEPARGYLLAWDPVAQKERWRADHGFYWSGGTLTTAGNLVFQGRADGFLVAYRASDGEELWKSWAATGVIAAPITWESEGTQYLSVVAGWGGAYGLSRPDAAGSGLERPGRILAFAIGGGRELDIESRSAPPTTRLARIPSDATSEQVARGAELYSTYCATCHGVGGVGGGVVPDLRRSGRRTFDSYEEIVLEGSYRDTGMPSLERWLDGQAVAAIRAYVLNRRTALIDGD